MTVFKPEKLVQVSEFEAPNVLDIFGFEEIYDSNGYPYLAFSPKDYHPDGPQMSLGTFPQADSTGRRANGGIVNLTEQKNSVEFFSKAMALLEELRTSYTDLMGSDTITYSDALKISHMGIELPRYLLWVDSSNYINGEVPPEALLLSRALRGFHGLVNGSLSFGMPPSTEHRQGFLQREFNAKEVLDPILNKRALENDLVCAAHINMISLMFRVFEGTKSFGNNHGVNIQYDTASLLHFSKSLRTIWGIVYPYVEAGRKKVREAMYLDMFDQVPQDMIDLPEFGNAVTYANMANFLIGSVVNFPIRELDYGTIEDAYMQYGSIAMQRQLDLADLIEDYRATNPI